MARYSAIRLLDKLLIYKNLIIDNPTLLPCNLTSVYHIQLLTAIRCLNERPSLTCNSLSIAIFLRANKHSTGYKILDHTISLFIDAGLVRKEFKRIVLTTAGLLALEEIETTLRTSHFKFKRTDTGRVTLPGPKKGCVMPRKGKDI